jgi:MFS family permease
MFRDPVLSASLAMNTLVSTVMMATLVVGPFYLSGALGLDAALVGIVMSIGPIVSALSGVLAGRLVDRLGAPFMVIAGLMQMAAGSLALSVLPAISGIAGYIAAIVVLTPGYQLFQAANNTAVMADIRADQRGVISGMLNLSRNLGLITGASVMGAVFAFASATTDIATAHPEPVAIGMRTTFAVAAVLIVVALAIAAGGRALTTFLSESRDEPVRGRSPYDAADPDAVSLDPECQKPAHSREAGVTGLLLQHVYSDSSSDNALTSSSRRRRTFWSRIFTKARLS